MKVPEKAESLADRWLSKKLGISGGAIVALTQLGLNPDKAGLYIVIVAGIYLIAQGAKDVMAANKAGVKLPQAILDEIKETVAEIKVGGA